MSRSGPLTCVAFWKAAGVLAEHGRVPRTRAANQKRRSRGDPAHNRRHEKQARCFEEGLGFAPREPGVTEVLGPVRCAEVLCLWFQDGATHREAWQLDDVGVVEDEGAKSTQSAPRKMRRQCTGSFADTRTRRRRSRAA